MRQVMAAVMMTTTTAVMGCGPSWRLVLSSAQAEVVGVAASTLGFSGFACSAAEGCRSELPSLSPVVTTELGLIEDERILLMSTDLVTTPVGEGLAALLGEPGRAGHAVVLERIENGRLQPPPRQRLPRATRRLVAGSTASAGRDGELPEVEVLT